MLNFIAQLWNGVTHDVGDVINRVLSSIALVITWITNLYQWALAFAAQEASDIAGAISTAASALSSAFTGLYSWAKTEFDNIGSWVGGLIQNAEDFARGLVSDLSNWVQSVINSLATAIQDASSWVVANVWQPLYGALTELGNYINTVVLGWIQQGLNDLRQWASDLINGISSAVSDTVNFIEGGFKTDWAIVKMAWSWIVFMAKFPLDVSLAIAKGFLSTSADTAVSSALNVFGSEGEGVLDSVMSWLEP